MSRHGSSLASLVLLTALCSLLAFAQAKDHTRWVDPFIGTGGHGHTFPGATMPFGMVQLSPDTRTDNWDGSSGYHYSDDIIYGFSHTHLSGTGIPDGCDILFMPTVGEPQFFAQDGDKTVNGYASKFSHANEHAEPGYYSVKLDDDDILAEMTATQRVGFHRYTFPRAGTANVVLNLGWRDRSTQFLAKIIDKRRIEGYRVSSSWAKRQIVYFVAEFSIPFEGASSGTRPQEQHVAAVFGDGGRRSLGTSFLFNLPSNKSLMLKVALSPVSIEGARKNLAAELPGWDFDKVRADAKAAWNKELSKIEVSGGTDAQTKTFYTALYHTMIQPNIFNDVDGNYRGHDRKIHNISDEMQSSALQNPAGRKGTASNPAGVRPPATAGGSDQYTVFSLWDTFRAAHPLYTIIEQKRTADFINTFLRIYEQGGRLPVWELWGEETDTMIGYHAVSVIADAMAKGIKGFDYEKAYEAAKHSAELDHFGLAAYKKRGYISMEDENESVSKTLEYAYDDWCIMTMAVTIHHMRSLDARLRGDTTYLRSLEADIEKYRRRAGNFENLFDPSTGFFRPKRNGGFVEPFAPNEVTFGFTEGNSWQYSFFVPHDVIRLMSLMGGIRNFSAKLDELFTTTDKLAGREQPDITGLIGQYAHGNEPSHHIAYLYDYAGQPWKTQKYVRKIMDEFYRPAPDGLIGNEDCGQMSAWYILSAAGIYEVTPGSGDYVFGTPLFPEIKFNLENGKQFVIRARNVSSKKYYIAQAKLNGKAYKRAYITYRDMMDGGVLDFTMADTPSETAFTALPASSIDNDTVAVPVIAADMTFPKSANVSISTLTSNATIRYTTDGSGPTSDSTLYTAPFTVDRSIKVRAIAFGKNGDTSFPVEAALIRTPNDWTVKVTSRYNTQYTGGGDEGLIDGIRGTTNFSSGAWQGYQGQDFVATVDLQKVTQILTLGGGFLQNVRSWIWMPTHIEFELSQDGVNFTKVADIKTDISQIDMEPRIRDYTTPIKPVNARYVRIHAYNFGKIPSWHPGIGGDPWIFVDEILINTGQ